MDPTDDNPATPSSKEASLAERSHEESIAAGEVPGAPLSPAALPTGLGVEAIQGPYGIRRDGPARFDGPARMDALEDGGAASPEPSAPDSLPADSLAGIAERDRPSFRFFGVVAALSLIADITTKVWAEVVINQRGFEPIKIVGENISITLAYNQGGAWGLFAGAEEVVRKPFFLGVSAFAIFFIISLYSKLHPNQKALKWGLPLVLGGALGNLSDRITRSQVIDFIDYRGDWVMSLNAFVHKYFQGWAVTDHWPTFNVADVAICVGVGLMAVDMFTHRPRPTEGRSSVGPSSPPGGPISQEGADPLAFDGDGASQDRVAAGPAAS